MFQYLPEKTPEFLIAFITAILGVGYPIILQAISRLDDQYNSLRITTIFKGELEMKVFQYIMISTLLGVAMYILNLPPLIPSAFLESSSVPCLLTLTVTLIVSYVLLIQKFVNYLSPNYLLNHFKKSRLSDSNEEKYYNALIDLLQVSLIKGNDAIVETIYNFLYTEFKKHRDNANGGKVTYPYAFYRSLMNIITTVLKKNSVIPSTLENGTIGAKLIFGSYDRHRLSDETYKWLWDYLITAIIHDQDRMVFNYWRNAYDYYSTSLQSGDYRDELDEQLEDDRNRFLEFHFALGGFLLYRGRYKCLQNVFQYTTSSPGTSLMLPRNMNQVFEWLNKFSDHGDLRSMAPLPYYFPENQGINSGDVVKNWIRKYVTILFIKEYAMSRSITYPNFPESIYEMTVWINRIPNWRRLTEIVMSDSKLLESINLPYLSNSWFVNHQLPSPTDFFDNLKSNLAEKISDVHQTQLVSENQVKKLHQFVKESLIPVMKDYSRLSGKVTPQNSEVNERYVSGVSLIQDKYFYTDDGEGFLLGRDGVPIRELITKVEDGYSEVIYQMRTEGHYFKIQDIKIVFQKLALNPEIHCIVAFGMDEYIANLTPYTRNLATGKINDIEVFCFKCYFTEIIGSSLFIVKRNDLPEVKFLEPFQNVVEKYHLRLVDEQFQTYCSVIDINLNRAVLKDLTEQFPDKDFSKSVEVLIEFTISFIWAKHIKCLMLQFPSNATQNEIFSNSEDLTPF